jgi:hypothetical protein
MIHCVNCDFHLPQHYVAACPYCGLDPRTVGEKPSLMNQGSALSSSMALEPTSQQVLSFGYKAAGTANRFTTTRRTPVRSSSQTRAKRHRKNASARISDGNDNLFGKILVVVVLITLATVAFEFRHLIAEFF